MSSNLHQVPVIVIITVTVLVAITVTAPVIITVIAIVIYIIDIIILSLVELPVQAQQILATWQTLKVSNILETADPPTTQAVIDTVTLLEMLTTILDQALQVATLTNKLANATYQIEALTNELASSETAMNMLCADLTEVKQIAAVLAQATPAGGRDGSDKKCILMPEKFNSTRSNLRTFLTQLWLKVATYPNE